MTTLPLSQWPDALFDARWRFTVSLASVAGYFRVPSNWRATLDGSSQHLLYFPIEGAFDARVGATEMRVQTGDLLWAPPGAHLRYTSREGEKLTLLRFRLSARDQTGELLTFAAPFVHLSPAHGCRVWMERIVGEASFALAHGECVTRALLACLCAEIARGETERVGGGRLSAAQRRALEAYASEHVVRWPSPAELANAVTLSPDYFARCFGATYGLAPRRWLVEQRVRLGALRLLESTLNVSQIARELGYDDVFLFSRQFKNVMGESPRDYRNNAT